MPRAMKTGSFAFIKKPLLPGFSQTMQQPTPQDALRSPFGETLLSSPTYVFFYTYKLALE